MTLSPDPSLTRHCSNSRESKIYSTTKPSPSPYSSEKRSYESLTCRETPDDTSSHLHRHPAAPYGHHNHPIPLQSYKRRSSEKAMGSVRPIGSEVRWRFCWENLLMRRAEKPLNIFGIWFLLPRCDNSSKRRTLW